MGNKYVDISGSAARPLATGREQARGLRRSSCASRFDFSSNDAAARSSTRRHLREPFHGSRSMSVCAQVRVFAGAEGEKEQYADI